MVRTPRDAIRLGRAIPVLALALLLLYPQHGAAAAATEAKPKPKAPKIARHADVRAEATGPGGAQVTYERARVTGARSVTYSKPSGSVFPLGTTVVTIMAKNLGGTARSSFKVVVGDTTAPVLGPLQNLTATAAGPGGATVAYPTITATDTVDPSPVVTCSPASGSLLPVGTTTVACSARDASGNAAPGSFDVVVSPAAAPHAGHYSGMTSQGQPIGFDVSSDLRTITSLNLPIRAACRPEGEYSATLTVERIVIQTDGAWVAAASGSGTLESGGTYRTTATVRGAFDAAGAARGTLQVHSSVDVGGTHYESHSGAATWTAS
jgi:hypothetical protein